MGELIDMTGERFGKLVVIERAPDKIDGRGKKVVMWKCQCDCGNIKFAAGGGLRAGNITSCGCNRAVGVAKYGIYKERKQLPPPSTIRDNLIIGETYRIAGKKCKCIGLYDEYARFEDDMGFTTGNCWRYWDLERLIKL